jgi:hypothetical protein
MDTMDLDERIKSFSILGETLGMALNKNAGEYSTKLNHLIDNQHLVNPWFTPENVRMALQEITDKMLTEKNLRKWTNAYPTLYETRKPVTAGLIMAGNIPLVGFHDYLSVLITGNYLLAKASSKDNDLIIFINRILCDIKPEFSERVIFTQDILSGFDVIIATGSDNSSRYFEYYFGKYPNIIRKNRNSISIIDSNESDSDLHELGKDIFSYFGLGCRNVSKLFVPAGYDFSRMINIWKDYAGVINNSKYASNYDFNKAVYLVNKEKFIDTGYLLLKESRELSSPVAVVYYEYYNSYEEVMQVTEALKEKIQCVVAGNKTPFGQAQSPSLWDYADGIDTIEFLLKNFGSGIL